MISRKSALVLAEAYTDRFASVSVRRPDDVLREELYDYLYERDHEPWFCNTVKGISRSRELKEWLMQMHTGESLAPVTQRWPWEKRREMGQIYLRNLAKDFIIWFLQEDARWRTADFQAQHDAILRRLELDGYVFRDGAFYQIEMDVLDVEAETGLLNKLYRSLSLASQAEAAEFLKLAEDHFAAARWSDSISNARTFFELTLQQIAAKHSVVKGSPLPSDQLDRPVMVRQYLETQGLVEKKEREAIDKIYGLLSHTGAHPYMAEEDQARMLRQLALTIAQFVLLRLEGALR